MGSHFPCDVDSEPRAGPALKDLRLRMSDLARIGTPLSHLVPSTNGLYRIKQCHLLGVFRQASRIQIPHFTNVSLDYDLFIHRITLKFKNEHSLISYSDLGKSRSYSELGKNHGIHRIKLFSLPDTICCSVAKMPRWDSVPMAPPQSFQASLPGTAAATPLFL